MCTYLLENPGVVRSSYREEYAYEIRNISIFPGPLYTDLYDRHCQHIDEWTINLCTRQNGKLELRRCERECVAQKLPVPYEYVFRMRM